MLYAGKLKFIWVTPVAHQHDSDVKKKTFKKTICP